MLEVWQTSLSGVYAEIAKCLSGDWDKHLEIGIAESVYLLVSQTESHVSFAITHYQTLGDYTTQYRRIIKPASWTSRIIEDVLCGVREQLAIDESEHTQCFYKLYDDKPHTVVGSRMNSYVISNKVSFPLAQYYIIRPILMDNPESISVFRYREYVIHVASGVLVLSSLSGEVFLTYDDEDSTSAYESWCNCQRRRSTSWYIH